MPLAKQDDFLTVEDYLAGEEVADVRHEYIGGYAYAMVGSTVGHNIISGNVFRELGIHLKGKPCQPFMADMKVKIDNKFYYPDVLVDCSKYINPKNVYTKEPVLIVEVLSNSTRTMDITTKFADYKTIPSLQEYVLIEQDSFNVQVYRRSEDWHSQTYLQGEAVYFESFDLALPMAEIYHGLAFGEKTQEQIS